MNRRFKDLKSEDLNSDGNKTEMIGVFILSRFQISVLKAGHLINGDRHPTIQTVNITIAEIFIHIDQGSKLKQLDFSGNFAVLSKQDT